MAKISFSGIDQWAQQIADLANKTSEITNASLYEGAKVVADSVSKSIDSIPTIDEYKLYSKQEIPISGLTEKQKQGLKNGLGIAKFENSQFETNTRIGFTGYNDVKTKKYPSGQPNAMIARSVARGTSTRVRNEFVKRAVSSSSKAAKAAMAEEFAKQIDKNTK